MIVAPSFFQHSFTTLIPALKIRIWTFCPTSFSPIVFFWSNIISTLEVVTLWYRNNQNKAVPPNYHSTVTVLWTASWTFPLFASASVLACHATISSAWLVHAAAAAGSLFRGGGCLTVVRGGQICIL